MQITRRFEFDAAHRVLGHGGKCRHLHGHRYVAEVTVDCGYLNALGMVVDFAEVKERIGTWIDEQWDHNTLLNSEDKLNDVLAPEERLPYVFQNQNPTAENIAIHLMAMSSQLLKQLHPDLVVKHVRIYETPNCWADLSR